MTKRPLAIELFAGLHGWGAGLAAAGFRVVGFDIVDMPRLLNHPVPEHCSLVLQERTIFSRTDVRDCPDIAASMSVRQRMAARGRSSITRRHARN